MDILQMSLTGAVMILAVMAVRLAALHRLPKRTFVALWAAVVLRLLLPWSLPSAFSIYSLAERVAAAFHPPGGTAAAPSPGTPEAVYGTELYAAFSSSGIQTASPDAAFSAALPLRDMSPWTAIWLGGVLACGVYFATAYLKCRRQFRMSLPAEQDSVCLWLEKNRLRRLIQVRQSGRIASPLTYGVLRPVILLPKAANNWDGDVLDYVLTHEYMHIRHLDAVLKLAVIAAVCIHWFNPLAWGMYALANRDMELSCDEAVLRRLGHGAKASYASALILMEEQISGLAPFAINFSKNAIEERITAIMKLKKISALALLAAAGAVICVTAVFATSAAERKSKREGTPTESTIPAWAAYEPFGITLNQKENTLYYNGEKVRYFEDSIALGGGTASRYNYYREDGTADLHTVRQARQKPDGSTDPFGTILGIEGFTPGEAQRRIKEYLSADSAACASAAEEFAAEKERLEDFQKALLDAYAHGSGNATANPEAIAVGTGTDEGIPLPDMFSKYAPFGITFQETMTADGMERNLYYNGKPVNRLIDSKPDGGVFTFGSSAQSEGGLTVYALYEHGKLAEVVQACR